MKKMKIAIIGLGNIGSYLFKYLNENKKILTENGCIPDPAWKFEGISEAPICDGKTGSTNVLDIIIKDINPL